MTTAKGERGQSKGRSVVRSRNTRSYVLTSGREIGHVNRKPPDRPIERAGRYGPGARQSPKGRKASASAPTMR